MRALLIALALAGAFSQAQASGLDALPAAGAAELDQLRGGFTFDLGGRRFDVAFGIERTVSVNGQAVSLSRLEVPQLSAVQNGPGNRVTASAAGAERLAVLQNSLDSQVLRQMTVINLRVASLQAMAAARAAAAIDQQIQRSAR